MADNPDIQWALNVLAPDPDYKPSIMKEYGLQIAVPISAFWAVCIRNTSMSRPWYAGFHNHILYSLISLALIYGGREFLVGHYDRRNQKVRHYITLHPEDFREPERKKWSEVLGPWHPVR